MDARNNIFLSLLFVAVFVVGFVVLFGERGLFHMIQASTELSDLQAENAALAQQQNDLARSVVRLKSDPAFVENMARAQFGMVGSQDLVFCFEAKKAGKEVKPDPVR
ncbi:MAG: septum formation initiator family protein [Thermodesulfobacteriota bacterium]